MKVTMKKIRSEFVARDGEKLHVHEIGQGEPVIFLHGWSASHERAWPLAASLAGRYRAIAWDARGHSAHPCRTDTPATLDQLADDLDAMLDWLKLDSVRLVGHSMGAALVWAYLRKYGCARVRQTVIIDMTPKMATDDGWPYGVYFDFPPARQMAFDAALRADHVEAIVELCAFGKNAKNRQLYENKDPAIQMQRNFLRRMQAQPLITLWQDLMQQDFREFLTTLAVPTLLVYGGESQFYGKELADWMLKTLPDAELLFLPEGDHSPYMQFPEPASKEMLAFFATATR